MKKIKTGIVILNYNNFNDTINCLKSIFEYCPNQRLLIAIIDNFSQNDSVLQISTYLDENNHEHQIIANGIEEPKQTSDICIIRTIENLGYARGNNIGIRFHIFQNMDNILVLNNDILLTSNLITPLINCLNKHPEIGIISPLLMKGDLNIDYNCCRNNPSNKLLILESLLFLKLPGIKNFIDKKYLIKRNPDLINQQLVYCDIVSGSCIMAKTTTWQKLNGFDENTFLYYEENILFEKLIKHNLKMALNTTVSAIHLGAMATKKVMNTKILQIELESLTYYLKNYRKINVLTFVLIKTMKLFHIQLVNANNTLKKLMNTFN